MSSNRWLRNSFAYLVILAAIAALFFTAFPQTGEKEVTSVGVSGLAKDVREGTVSRIQVGSDDRITIDYFDKRRAVTRKESNGTISQQLRDYGVTPEQLESVNIVVSEPSQFGNWMGILFNLLPLVFFGGILLFMMRQ